MYVCSRDGAVYPDRHAPLILMVLVVVVVVCRHRRSRHLPPPLHRGEHRVVSSKDSTRDRHLRGTTTYKSTLDRVPDTTQAGATLVPTRPLVRPPADHSRDVCNCSPHRTTACSAARRLLSAALAACLSVCLLSVCLSACRPAQPIPAWCQQPNSSSTTTAPSPLLPATLVYLAPLVLFYVLFSLTWSSLFPTIQFTPDRDRARIGFFPGGPPSFIFTWACSGLVAYVHGDDNGSLESCHDGPVGLFDLGYLALHLTVVKDTVIIVIVSHNSRRPRPPTCRPLWTTPPSF